MQVDILWRPAIIQFSHSVLVLHNSILLYTNKNISMQCEHMSEQLLHKIRLVFVTRTYNLSRREGLPDRLRDRQAKHRVNLITSMRFRTWELSVICTTETTDTVWERHDENTTTTQKNRQQK